MKRLLTASVLIFASGCGGGGSTQAPPVGVVCPAMAAMGSLVYPASGAVGVLDSQSVVVVAGGLSVETLQFLPQSGQNISSTTMVPVPPLPMSSTPIPYSPLPGFSDPEARRSNKVPCNRRGAVAVLRTYGVRLVHDEIASAVRRSRKLINRASDSGYDGVQRNRYNVVVKR
jgi:hypothetical protein